MDTSISEELREVRFLPRRRPVIKRVGLRRCNLHNHLVLLNEVLNDDFSVKGYEIVLEGPLFEPLVLTWHSTAGAGELGFYDAVRVLHVEYKHQRFTLAQLRTVLTDMLVRYFRYLLKLLSLVAFGYFLQWVGVFDFFIDVYKNVTDYLGIRETLDNAVAAALNYKELTSKYFLIFWEKAQKFNEGIF